MKAIRTWRRNWLVLDFIALCGVLGLVVYVQHKNLYPDDRSPLTDVWFNVALLIVGSWISVRVIDYIIGRRERYNNIRTAVVGNLGYMLDISKDVSPNFYRWRVRSIQSERTWFLEKWKDLDRKKRFTNDEQSDVEACIEQVKAIHETANDAMQAIDELDDLYRKLNRDVDRHNKQQNYVNAIQLYQIDWFRDLTDEVERFRRRALFDTTIATTALTSADQSNFPTNIVSLIRAYTEQITSVVESQKKLTKQIDEYETQFRKTRANIFEESEPE